MNMLNTIKRLLSPFLVETIAEREQRLEARRHQIWKERREYEKRNEAADLEMIDRLLPAHRERALAMAERMGHEDLVYKLRELNTSQPLPMPGGHIDTFHALEEACRDIYETALVNCRRP
jgi:hypothetical protein